MDEEEELLIECCPVCGGHNVVTRVTMEKRGIVVYCSDCGRDYLIRDVTGKYRVEVEFTG